MRVAPGSWSATGKAGWLTVAWDCQDCTRDPGRLIVHRKPGNGDRICRIAGIAFSYIYAPVGMITHDLVGRAGFLGDHRAAFPIFW